MSARSLEGKIFYVQDNNGVSALITGEVMTNIRRYAKIQDALLVKHLPYAEEMKIRRSLEDGMMPHLTPVFTFVKYSRLQKEPFYTGSHRLYNHLRTYIGVQGGKVEHGKSFHVPFSNGAHNHGFRYVTVERQFVDAFGITPAGLMREDGPLLDDEG